MKTYENHMKNHMKNKNNMKLTWGLGWGRLEELSRRGGEFFRIPPLRLSRMGGEILMSNPTGEHGPGSGVIPNEGS